MALILNIETSTKNCSVSISNKNEIISLVEQVSINYSHGEQLHPFIIRALKDVNLKLKDLDAIAVGKGPGSYTGLRIGVSAAKGLCFSSNKPLISISSLDILANSVKVKSGVIIPMIDARRMEVYSAVYNKNYKKVREIEAQILDYTSFDIYLKKGNVCFVGDGVEKSKSVIKNKNVEFVSNMYPSANNMASLSFDKYKISDFEDVAYFEPFYLKDFIVTQERKRL